MTKPAVHLTAARRMLTLEDVLTIVPVSRATLFAHAEQRFPPGHFISPNRRVWCEDEVAEWQNAPPTAIRASRRLPKSYR